MPKVGDFMERLMEDETLDDLQLKGLSIIQKKKAFRFGVDAVLLANFAKIKNNSSVIDLCSGTGIVPFILAGKTSAKSIIGVEIQQEMVEMAKRSVSYNNLEERVSFAYGDIKDAELIKSLERVDVVTVNPPYKAENSGLISIDEKEAIARHEICCNLEDVVSAARALLKDNGKFYMVHRPERLIDIFILMRKYRIEPKSLQLVHPDLKSPPNIVLIEGQRDGKPFLKWQPPLFIYKYGENGNKIFSEELNRLYGRN